MLVEGAPDKTDKDLRFDVISLYIGLLDKRAISNCHGAWQKNVVDRK